MFSGYFLERAITATRSPCSLHVPAVPPRSSQTPVLWMLIPNKALDSPRLSHLSQDLAALSAPSSAPFHTTLICCILQCQSEQPSSMALGMLAGKILLWKQQRKCQVCVKLELDSLFLDPCTRYLHAVLWILCSCKAELPSFSPSEPSLKNWCSCTHGEFST